MSLSFIICTMTGFYYISSKFPSVLTSQKLKSLSRGYTCSGTQCSLQIMTPPILGRLQVTPSLSDGAAKGNLFLVLLIGCGWSHANGQGILELYSRHMDGIIPGAGRRGGVNIALHSMTDLLKGLLGTPTEDTSSLGERNEDSRWGRCC